MSEPITYLPADSYLVPLATKDESSDEFQARLFAAHAHRAQKRKYTHEPYITHPKAVADWVRNSRDNTIWAICVAWLHDTIEDCEVTHAQLMSEFTNDIADGVLMLTNEPPQKGLNRAQRKLIDVERMSHASPSIKTVKLADLIHNSASIMKHDPEFAKNYLAEKRALLAVLKDGCPWLWNKADTICRTAGY